MSCSQSRKITGKNIALLILIATVAAVVVTLIQHLVLGHSSPAVTGGVVGALVAAMAISLVRKK